MSKSGLLRLIRWPGAVTAASNAATGFLVAHARTSREEMFAIAGVCAGALLVYAGGVVLNDVADADRDATLHPARPIPSGQVTRTSARGFGVMLLVVGAACSMILAGPWAGAATAAAALLAFAYDFAVKGSRLPGALCLGAARGANGLAGVLAGVASLEALSSDHATLALVYPVCLLAYTALLTYASTFEETKPTKFTAGASAVALLVAAALPWAVFIAAWHAAPALAYAPLACVLIIAARQACEEDGPGMGALVRAAVFAFLLVDAAWLFGVGRYDAGFALLLAYAAMRLVLARARS